MKLPRSLSGAELVKKLSGVGYIASRQTGSHIRLSHEGHRTHHITIPNHNPLRVGTLSSIISEAATHLEMSKDDLIKKLFSWSLTVCQHIPFSQDSERVILRSFRRIWFS